MANERERRVDLPESSHAMELARCDDMDQRGWGLEPKHTIFLSHSGKQKNFTEWLWKELKQAHYSPFLDKDPDSLLKGHDFPSAIIQAARQCHVAILVLSEDFFTQSRWPMIELNEFVKAQASPNSKLKLLPLFYKISVAQFKDPERQKQWQAIWQGWATEDIRSNRSHKLDVGAWCSTLSTVGRSNGLEYVKEVGEVTYVANVVEAVRKLKVPHVKYDVSHVQSLPRLCEAIFAKCHDSEDEHPDYKVRVVGLFGMGGVGKTTITKAMCNGRFGDFVGDFCHVELGVKDVGVVRKQLLQDLTGEKSLPDDLDKLKTLLKKCMQHRKVFLCLDNVWLEDIEEAKMYLNLNFKVGSKVLVTSRSREILRSLHLQECHCIEMPKLEEDDATKLFLHYVDLGSTKNLNELELDIINKCVQACKFSGTSLCGSREDSRYLPLALKVWGTQLGQISRCPLEWKSSLENLRTHKFNHANVKIHPLFSLLRQGYDSLELRDQFIFLDLAIFVNGATKHSASSFASSFDIMKWLQHAHNCKIFPLKQSLEALKRKALLDFTMTKNVLEFCIHDLYLEFAEEEIQDSKSSSLASHFLYDFGSNCLPPKLRREWKCRNLRRMGIHKSEVKSIKRDDLLHCFDVEVLQVFWCKNLEELDVEGMDGLRVLDVVGCEKLGKKFRGVNKLKDLEWLRLHIPNRQVFLGDLSSLTNLQFLEMDGGVCKDLFHPADFSQCNNLRELIINGDGSFPNLGNLTKLQKLDCGDQLLESPIGLISLTNLKVLILSHLLSLVELPGLCDLVALEILNVSCTNLLELPGIGKLQHLQELLVFECEYLTSLIELEYVTSLRRLEAKLCSSLHELPSMMNLKNLEVVDLSGSGISVVPSGFGRLAKDRIFKLVGCMGLFEPLVLWLREEEIFMRFLDIEIEEVEEDYESCTRKDVVYYMEQITSEDSEELGLANFLYLLSEVHGGIDFAIEALCDYEDLGILSLVVATYSAELFIVESTNPKLSSRIIDFLNQQRSQPLSERDNHHDLGPPTFWCISSILEHVMENDLLMKSLEANGIYLFMKQFVNDDQHRSYCRQFSKYLNPILNQWLSYLNQCCFYEDCSCLD